MLDEYFETMVFGPNIENNVRHEPAVLGGAQSTP
jgi:hypothetical protein